MKSNFLTPEKEERINVFTSCCARVMDVCLPVSSNPTLMSAMVWGGPKHNRWFTMVIQSLTGQHSYRPPPPPPRPQS